MEKIIYAGIVLLLIGIAIIFIGSILSALKAPDKSSVKVAAGGFIGPIPFGFFTDKKMFYVLIALMALALIFWFVFRKI